MTKADAEWYLLVTLIKLFNPDEVGYDKNVNDWWISNSCTFVDIHLWYPARHTI